MRRHGGERPDVPGAARGGPGGTADSAGVPWAGRAFHPNQDAADDGSAPPELLAALERFRAGGSGIAALVGALRGVRLLVPLVADRGEEGVGAHGQLVDKTQELSIVTVAGPDGRAALPAFTSVDAMRRWRPEARPVPVEAPRIALAAASEACGVIVIDPTSPTEFAVRRPAFRALATGEGWVPSFDDDEVRRSFEMAAAGEPDVRAVELAPGDPEARLRGAELVVGLTLRPGLDRSALGALVDRLQRAWAADAVIAERVDSIAVRLGTAPGEAPRVS